MPIRSSRSLALVVVLAASALACRNSPRSVARAEQAVAPPTSIVVPTPPAPSASPASPAPLALGSVPPPSAPAPSEPATVTRIPVSGDLDASLVGAADGAPPRAIFLPGLCSNANAYLQSFPEAAHAHGGIVAIDGDLPCRGAPGFHSFTWDAARQHVRIQAALVAAGHASTGGKRMMIVGYSQGAAIAEQLVQRWPEHYDRVVLIGAPTDPAPAHFATAKGVVTISCSRDVPPRMRSAARKIDASGVPATYIEMPGCGHGNIAEGERVFGEAFDFLDANAKPASSDTNAKPASRDAVRSTL